MPFVPFTKKTQSGTPKASKKATATGTPATSASRFSKAPPGATKGPPMGKAKK